jgi:proteasome lid subunit RPN8/RPN11
MEDIQNSKSDAFDATESEHPDEHSELKRLPSQQPPLSNSCWLHGERPGPGEVNIIAGQQALRQIWLHGESNVDSELGGALLGHAFRHEQRIFVDVKAALPAVSGDHGPVHFTFSADSWAQLHLDRSARYPDLEVVGWFHTHPDLGVFYSGDDAVVHSAAFTLPWQIGLVLDPVRKEGGFFGWVGGKLSPIAGFYERHEEQQDSATNWKTVAGTVWFENPENGARASRVYAPSSGWPSLPTYAAPLGVLFGALGLIFSLFLLAGWVIPLNRQLGRLQDVVLMLAQEGVANEKFAGCPDSRLRILAPASGDTVIVGDETPVIGTAAVPNAFRYRVEVKAAGGESWSLLQARRRSSDLAELARWDTAEARPGPYQLRLTAVDRNNIILPNSPDCLVALELGP